MSKLPLDNLLLWFAQNRFRVNIGGMRMAKINEKKVWRIVARIDDEIIVKQASSVEKATRSVRNAVCQRLCDSAGIEYELGWWKGSRHRARRDFVDNFIGTPLYVQIDDEVEIDLHEVPYEVYTIQQVRLTFRKMTLMTPDNIDAWGFLHWGPYEDEKNATTRAEITNSITSFYDKKFRRRGSNRN